jgi:hypothetical protein
MALDHRAGRKAIRLLAIALFVAVAAVAMPGCLFGGDDDDVTTLTETVPPTNPKKSDKDKKKKKGEGKEKQGSGAAAAGGACGSSREITNLRAAGTSCATAQALAKRWQRMQDSCNTIDDPNSPQGYSRTCTVSGYRCTAKRDTRSDRRFVTCTKGSAKVRFTFLG